MKPELEKLCAEFIINRDIVRETFRGDNKEVYPVCANLFCASGCQADMDHLKKCRQIITEQTGFLSRFRGMLRTVVSCMLALDANPEKRMSLANECYHMLRQAFKDTEYLALTAFLLTESEEKSLVPEKIARGKELYRRMNKEHPVITNNTDSVFAMMLAFSGKTDDELIDDLEACYQSLKTQFSGSGDTQTAAQILAMAAGTPEEKVQRLIDMYNTLLEIGVQYGHSDELAPLTALSLTDIPLSTLAEEIKEVDEFLKNQEGYDPKDVKPERRAVHAVMIVSDQYVGTDRVNSSVMTNTLDQLIANRRSLYISVGSQAIQLACQILAGWAEEQAKKNENEAGAVQEQQEEHPGSQIPS